MYMRVKFFIAAFSIVILLLLSGCAQVIDNNADELRLYEWQGETEGGNTAALRFDGSDASFEIDFLDTEMIVSGFCTVSDDSLMICDDETGFDYTFDYKLYGDRVELTFDSSQISLKKMK